MGDKIWKVVPYALIFMVLSLGVNMWRLPAQLRGGVMLKLDRATTGITTNANSVAWIKAVTVKKVEVLEAMLGGLDGIIKDGCINVVIKDTTDRKGNTTRTVNCE